MKAKEVMKILNICRTTLYKYTKDGTLKSIQLDNGYFDYDEKSVYSLLKKDDRHNVIYARVSTYKQKIDLNMQISKIQTYCTENNIQINLIYSEISSGLDLDRPQFSKLLDDIFEYKIKNIYISNKDRLTRLSFRTYKIKIKDFYFISTI